MNHKSWKMLSVIAHKADLILWFLSVPLFADDFCGILFTTLSADAQPYFKAYYFILWAVFTAEISLRLVLSKDKTAYVKEN